MLQAEFSVWIGDPLSSEDSVINDGARAIGAPLRHRVYLVVDAVSRGVLVTSLITYLLLEILRPFVND
jgi:hypothetical protein